jgi:hypothetical protein
VYGLLCFWTAAFLMNMNKRGKADEETRVEKRKRYTPERAVIF